MTDCGRKACRSVYDPEADFRNRYVCIADAVRPTLRTASKNRRGRPRSELKKIAVTLIAIAAIAQIG